MLGIIWGLYFNFSIVLLYILLLLIYIILINILKRNSKNEFKLLSVKRYFRYIKIFLNLKVCLFLIISSIISNSIILIKEYKYENLYQEKNIKVEGIVTNIKKKTEYMNTYEFKVIKVDQNKKYKNTKIFIVLDSKIELKIGDKILCEGVFSRGEKQRNYKCFDYNKYLKSIEVYGILKVEKYKHLSNNNKINLSNITYKIKEKIVQNIEKVVQEDEKNFLIGLVLGDKLNLDEEIKENFQISNISHILAVSGMHVGYIVIGIKLIGEKILGKRKIQYIIILFLFFYMNITGFTSSILRAGIVTIIDVISFLVYRKKDTWSAIGISLLIIIVKNPYALTRYRITIIIFRNCWDNSF